MQATPAQVRFLNMNLKLGRLMTFMFLKIEVLTA